MSFEEIQISERGDDDVEDVPNGAAGRNVRSSSLAAAFFGAPPPVAPHPSASSPSLAADVESSMGTNSTSLSSLTRKIDFRSIVERTRSNEERKKKQRIKDQQSTQDIFTTTDVLSKPFNFVSGMVSTKSRNPLKKKSGILNVLSSKGQRKRIVLKDGSFNMEFNTHGKSHRLIKDILVSALQLGWTATFGLFACAFFISWLLFAVVWYLTALQHGDFDEVNTRNESFVKCVDAIEDFTSCFLFSIETQHTIGYGGR